MPHPLEQKIEVKIQTNGEKRPTESFVKAIDGLNYDVNSAQREFDKKFKDFVSSNY